MAGRSTATKPGVYAGWRALYYSNHIGLHLLELLRLSRENQSRTGLSLNDEITLVLPTPRTGKSTLVEKIRLDAAYLVR